MGNMSYCRFENTARDLQDCLENMPNSLDELSSDYERRGYKKLLRLCREIAADYPDTESEAQ